MIKQFFDSVFNKKQLYCYIDEELIINNVPAEKLIELDLPDFTRVKKMGDKEWQRWGDIKEIINI